MNKEQVLIKEIHDSFDEAQDVLLKEAEETTEANKVDTVKVKEMVKLGFVNAKGVQEASQKMKLAVEAKRLAKLVLHYKGKYPFLKFLTEAKLDEICEKYDLIHAPVQNYIEAVPEKNMKEIIAAQELDVKDAREDDVKNITSGVDRFGVTETEQTVRAGLFIAAPESHFDLKGLTKKGTRGFFKTIIKKETKDPIVFRYVKGGIQVLTKWGLEANDPALANPLDN